VLKTIGNFTQTYSTTRIETAKVLSKDKSLGHFFNKLDQKYFSFHNLANDKEYCKQYAAYVRKNFNNVEFLIYSEPYYTHTATRHLDMLIDRGCTDIFFTQDDVVCTVPDNALDTLDVVYDFYKNSKEIKLLSFHTKSTRLINAGAKPRQIVEISKKHNLYAYEFLTTDFTKANLFEMDDSTYIGDIKLIKAIYNEKYRTFYNMDEAEGYVKETCTVNPVSRWLLNKRLFRYFYYHGMHVYTSEKRIEELKLLKQLFNFKNTGKFYYAK
jgi:hypothetical protein